MNTQIIANINTFIRKRLIESSGILLIFFSIFLLAVIVSYSPSDPNFIYTPESTEIKNVGGFYGSVISDFLLQALGLISILLVFNFLSWGFKLFKKKTVNNFTTKIFFVISYLILGTTVANVYYNDSFWLIDNGNGGFVGQTIKENIYYFTPLIENEYIIYGLGTLTIVFFILSLSINLKEIIKILFFPLIIIKKIYFFFKQGKEKKFT